jgi:RNA polymerase subunit RPABC4/transcription elongation factor Spt4
MSPRKAASGETATCPWCSATVPTEAMTCPSCGASLRDAAAGEVLGVTQVDPAAVARAKQIRSARNIAVFLGVGDGPAAAEMTGKVEPLSEAVRQEMLRLELAAIDAEIEAKSKEAAAQRALAADAGTEGAEGADSTAKPG